MRSREINYLPSGPMKPQDINPYDFAPDWRSPPGDTIRDIVKTLRPNTSEEDIQMALALALGITVPDAIKLLAGTLPIDATLAGMLGVKLGGSARFWLNRESQYRVGVAGRKFDEQLKQPLLRTFHAGEEAALDVASHYEEVVHFLAREVVRMADVDVGDHPDNVVTRDEHALRVLFEGRLAADVAEAVATLREGRKT